MVKGKVGVRTARGEPWPDPRKGPWVVRLIQARREGQSVCIGVEIEPMREDCRALTKTELRTLSLRSIAERDRVAQIARARASLKRLTTGPLADQVDPRQVDNLRDLASPSSPMPRRGRPPMYDDAHYRRVAVFYSEMAAEFHNPTQLLAAEENVEPSTARRWVKEARKRGHLPPTEPGVARGNDMTEGDS